MRTLSRILVIATFFLLIAGGLVTSTGSGLAVPDWPLSYGRLMPPMVGGILYEHGHRMLAATVGMLTLILTVWIGRREPRRGVRGLAIAALGAVLLQGILGGLTVLWQLPTPISIAHAVLGQTFFVLVVLLARCLAPSSEPGAWHRVDLRPSPLPVAAGLTTAAIYLQLILGATLRHASHEAVVRLPFAAATGWHPRLVLAHVLGAGLVAGSILWTAWIVRHEHTDDPRCTRRAVWLAALLLAQLGLGLATLISGRVVWLATAHVAVGALLLAHAAVLTWHLGVRYLRTKRCTTARSVSDTVRAYLELTKPRLTLLAVVTTFAGFSLGSATSHPARLLAALVGAWLVGSGAGTLNQALEWEPDGRMRRTRQRPIPSGRVTPQAAGAFGMTLAALGVAVLAIGTNLLTAGLGLLTLISYLGVYTPLKTRTPLCTLIGAIPGAMPPLIGWAAARGALDPGAWALFALLFLWQLPHFLALAWLYREDYARAGFRMLPAMDPAGGPVARQITLDLLALLPASLIPTIFGMTGAIYFFGALALGLALLGIGVTTARGLALGVDDRVPGAKAARRLFLASIAYLPGLLALMALDRVG